MAVGYRIQPLNIDFPHLSSSVTNFLQKYYKLFTKFGYNVSHKVGINAVCSMRLRTPEGVCVAGRLCEHAHTPRASIGEYRPLQELDRNTTVFLDTSSGTKPPVRLPIIIVRVCESSDNGK